MLVYGGRNELAFNVPKDDHESLRPQVNLDDIMVFDFALKVWTAVLQHGSRPVGRWSAGMYYSDEQLFVFGGGSYAGTVKGDVFVCDFNAEKVSELKSQYRKVMEDLNSINVLLDKKDQFLSLRLNLN